MVELKQPVLQTWTPQHSAASPGHTILLLPFVLLPPSLFDPVEDEWPCLNKLNNGKANAQPKINVTTLHNFLCFSCF